MAKRCCNSGVHAGFMLMSAAVLFALATPALGQSSPISACAAVLQQGVYNSVTQSTSSQSYSQLQTTLCTYDSSYTYATYVADHSSQSTDSYARHIDATASQIGVWGASGSADWGDNHMTADQFSLFQNNAYEYKRTSCGASLASSSADASVQYINNWIDPNVISSWQSCVKNFATGTAIQSVNGVNGDSVTLNILFSSSVSGATASLNGYSVTPTRAAVCTLFGPKVTTTAKTSLVFPLAPSVAYNVYCVINATQLTRAIDVFVYTSPGGYYHAILYNAISPTQIARLQAQIVNLQAQVSSANQQIANCQALANSVDKKVVDLQSLVNSFYKNGEINVLSVNLFAYDDPGTKRYTIGAFQTADPKTSVLIIRDWLAQMRGEDVRIAYYTGVADLSTTEPVFLQTGLDAWKIASSTQQRLASIYDGTQLVATVIRSTSGQFYGLGGANAVVWDTGCITGFGTGGQAAGPKSRTQGVRGTSCWPSS
eukprot:jgi/Chlat1/8054/Chrsp73S07523